MNDGFDIYEDVGLNFDPNQLKKDSDPIKANKEYRQQSEDSFSLYDDLGDSGYSGFSRDDRENDPENLIREDLETPEGTTEEVQTALYIGNLTWWTTDQELETLFAAYGKLKTLRFFEDKVNGKSKGYAFVEFFSQEQAGRAKEEVQGR